MVVIMVSSLVDRASWSEHMWCVTGSKHSIDERKHAALRVEAHRYTQNAIQERGVVAGHAAAEAAVP
jgi:hypothetical protein